MIPELDAHIHTWVSDYLEDKKEVGGVPVAEEAHVLYLSDLFDERTVETDKYMAILAEHDGRVENKVYIEELEDNDYDVDDYETYLTAERGEKQAIAIIGAQVNAHDEYGVQKDVVAAGVSEDATFSADKPQKLYEQVADEAEGLIVTHVHAFPKQVPTRWDPKWMGVEDAIDVTAAAKDYDTPVALGRPTAYPSPTNWLMQHNWFQGETAYEVLPDLPVINEFDLHDIEDIPKQDERSRNTNYVPNEVFDDFFAGNPDYEELFNTLEPSDPVFSLTNLKKGPNMLAEQFKYRMVPAVKGWTPE